MASNGSDYIQVSPEQLREMANLFQKASQDTSTLLEDLKHTAQQIINDMYSELKNSPDALQLVCNQWYTAMNSEKDFLQEVARSLSTIAENFQTVDQNGMPKGLE